MKIFRIDHVPPWAGITLVGIVTYGLNNFILPSLPFLHLLPNLGLIPYGTTAAGILGLWFAKSGEDDRAEGAANVCAAFGLLATVKGFAEYLMVFETDSTNYEGLKLCFIGTGHGLVMSLSIGFLLLWPHGEVQPEQQSTPPSAK